MKIRFKANRAFENLTTGLFFTVKLKGKSIKRSTFIQLLIVTTKYHNISSLLGVKQNVQQFYKLSALLPIIVITKNLKLTQKPHTVE